MKKLVFLLLLIPNICLGAWTRVGTFAVGNSTSSSSTLVVATSAALEAGNVGVCSIAADESGSGTTDGDNNQITSVTDASGGNTWNEGLEYCNMQTSTAANGACGGVFWTKAATQINLGANITVNFTAAITTKALTCDEFTITGGNVVTIAAGQNGAPYDGANVGSLTDVTGVSREHLFVRGSACESSNTGYGVDADYVAFGGSTTTSTAVGGTSATSMGARGESRIANESTSAASDPDYPSSAGTADCASEIIALDEDTPPATTGPAAWKAWW